MIPKSYSMAQIARAWDVTRARVWDLYRQGRLPDPVRLVDETPIWDAIPEKPKEQRRGPKIRRGQGRNR